MPHCFRLHTCLRLVTSGRILAPGLIASWHFISLVPSGWVLDAHRPGPPTLTTLLGKTFIWQVTSPWQPMFHWTCILLCLGVSIFEWSQHSAVPYDRPWFDWPQLLTIFKNRTSFGMSPLLSWNQFDWSPVSGCTDPSLMLHPGFLHPRFHWILLGLLLAIY